MVEALVCSGMNGFQRNQILLLGLLLVVVCLISEYVMDLFDARCHVWRDPLLNVLFPREVVSAIHSIYLPLQRMN